MKSAADIALMILRDFPDMWEKDRIAEVSETFAKADITVKTLKTVLQTLKKVLPKAEPAPVPTPQLPPVPLPPPMPQTIMQGVPGLREDPTKPPAELAL